MVLLEVIVSLVLFSIIAIISSKMIFTLAEKTTTQGFSLEQNLLLETTRLFLLKKKSLDRVTYSDDTLYFDGNIILKNVSTYQKTLAGAIAQIRICVHNESICQVWKIKIV